MALKSVMLLYEFEDVFLELETDEERSQLIMAIFAYRKRGEEPQFTSGLLRFAWRTHIKPKLDEMADAYSAKVQKLRENANKRWAMQNDANACKSISENANARYKEKEKEKEKEKAIAKANARVANQNSDEVNEAIRFFAEQIAPVPGDAIRPFDLLVKCYGLDAFKAAVQIMKRRGGHSLRYLEMILKDPRTMAAAGDDLPEEVIRHVLR